MDQTSVLYLLLLVPCLLLSAFFSASEAAFLSMRRFRTRDLVERQVPGAERVERMVAHPERLLPTILLGNNMANTAMAALATVVAISVLGEGRGVIVATASVTIVLLILGETGPKTIAVRHPERVAFFSARFLEWIELILMPVAAPLQWISRAIVNIFGGDARALITEGEIKAAIAIGQETGAVEEQEAEMLEKVFRFGDRQVREVMTPRVEVVWVEAGTALKGFLSIYLDHSHTRFPVFDGDMENVVGVLSVKDVVAAMARGELSPDAPVTVFLRPVHFVPDTKLAGALFREMQALGNQIVLAIDEFGGIAGLVTLKQLTEEIVGPVGEEGAQAELEYETIDENTFHVDGGMQIEEANEELGLGLPDGDYETVAGFILETLGHIPEEGEQLRHDSLRMAVTQMNGMRIEKVMVTKVRPNPWG